MLREQLSKRTERTGLVWLARTLEPARTLKFQVPKQRAKYQGVLIFMPKGLRTLSTPFSNGEVIRNLVFNNLSLQGGK